MLFHSNQFLLFFILIFSLYWCLSDIRHRKILLLFSSYWFYMAWDWQLGLLIIVSTVLDFFLGIGLEKQSNERYRRFLICLSLVGNLGLLGYFKYYNFFRESFEALTGIQSTALVVILPAGISFYTFQTISYTIDVYRRQIKAERNIVDFALFIAFFPQLIAGPIVRAKDFLPQLAYPKRWNWDNLQRGTALFLMGLFKKVVIADTLSMVVEPVFSAPEQYSALGSYLASVCFAVQIYADFSGYSDMAVGLALCFGYKLMENFNVPFIASNPSDFWKRWNISLSTWLRDYLYISLGGNRSGKWNTARNLMITMTLGGLWHGANWTFVLWGVFHGGYLLLYHLSKPFLPKTDNLVLRFVLILLNFHIFLIGWILFRAANLDIAMQMFLNIAGQGSGTSFLFDLRIGWILVLVFVGHVLGSRYTFDALWIKLNQRIPGYAIGTGYALILLVIGILSPERVIPFLYFQF